MKTQIGSVRKLKTEKTIYLVHNLTSQENNINTNNPG